MTYCLPTVAEPYTISFDSTEPAELCPHYAYLVIRIFPGNVPTYLAVPCHYGETDDIFFLGGFVQLSLGNITNTIQIFLLKQLRQLIGFYQPFNQFSKMHLYWEQDVLMNTNLLLSIFTQWM